MKLKSDLSVIVLTMNEEKNIEKCISSVKDLAARIIIVDSGSSDKTIEIAKNLGADVYHHAFENYARQFNWGLDNTGINTRWVLRLDADEVITPELAEEMAYEMSAHKDDDINGMQIKLKKCFLGRWLKYGGSYPFVKLMLFKNGIGRIEDRKMDEHTVLSKGRTIMLKNDALHYDFKDVNFFIHKHNWYSIREAQDLIENRMDKGLSELEEGSLKSHRQQKLLYYKAPRFIRAFLLFIYYYIFKLGFLDGKEGFIYCVLEYFWYRFLVDVKIFEYEKTGYIQKETGALK